MFRKYGKELDNVTFRLFFAALDMTGRQSVPALKILTKIKIELEEFKEALDLVKEQQRLLPGVSVLNCRILQRNNEF